MGRRRHKALARDMKVVDDVNQPNWLLSRAQSIKPPIPGNTGPKLSFMRGIKPGKSTAPAKSFNPDTIGVASKRRRVRHSLMK